MILIVNSCVSQLHLPSYVPWLYLLQKRRKETPSLRFLSSFSPWIGNFSESLSMPFSLNAILPLGVFLKLIHYDSRKTEKLLRSHQQHPVTPEHTCVFDVIQIYFVRDSVTHLLCLCETSFQTQRRHEAGNLVKLGRGHCRKKKKEYLARVFSILFQTLSVSIQRTILICKNTQIF